MKLSYVSFMIYFLKTKINKYQVCTFPFTMTPQFWGFKYSYLKVIKLPFAKNIDVYKITGEIEKHTE